MNLINKLKTLKTNREYKEILDNQIFSVEFIKKDGSLRKMVARMGVTKGVSGVGMKYDPISKGLLPVYDMQKHSYRMINIETIQLLKVKGELYE